jgi:hypothetical protein
MSDTKLTLPGGAEFIQPELSTTQVPVASGAGTIAAANNIVTVTTASAHGLTMAPAAGTMPNFFVQFTGITGQAGTGTLVGPIFRILAIPSTTTLQVYSTVTAGTFTAGTIVPVFLAPFTAILGSVFVGFLNNLGTSVPGALVQSSFINAALGPNCTIQYNPDNTSIVYDGTTGNTPAVAPTYRTLVAASGAGQLWLNGPQMALFASGSAGTSRISVLE